MKKKKSIICQFVIGRAQSETQKSNIKDLYF